MSVAVLWPLAVRIEFEGADAQRAATARLARELKRLLLYGVVDQQALERVDADVIPADDVADHRHALFGRKHRLLFDVEQKGDDHLIKQLRRPLDYVQVSVSDRVKRPGIDCAARHSSVPQKVIIINAKNGVERY